MALRGRIVYLVSFDGAEAAVTWQVAELSKAWQTPVLLLAVQPSHWLSFLARDRNRVLKRRLLEVAKRLRGLKTYVGGLKVVAGDPATEARRLASQTGAALLVTGAGEDSIRDPAAVSALALDVARRARQDVWICKPSADPHLQHVLCAADTSPLAADAVRRSADLCRRFNARLRVVSVMGDPGAAEDPDEAARRGLALQRAFLDQFDLRGIALSRATLWGRQAQVELLLEAERYADGLLVIGAASNAGSRGLGATAAPVLRACPSSILLVRRHGHLAEEDGPGTAVATCNDADGGRDPQAAPTSPPSR